jgi:TP901 family phage tail tape measure protein
MPDRDVRIRLFVDDSNLKPLAAMTTLLQKAAAAEKTLMGSALKKNKAIQKQAQVVGKDNTALKDVSKSTRTWTQQIVKNIGKVAEWGIATGIVFGAIRTLRTAIDDIVDVEFAMAGLTKVMQDGEIRSKRLRPELLALGHQYGELGDEVVDASTEWARLQISTIEIAQNAETALLAQAVAEMQVVQASGFLIASMQQFEQTSLSNIRTLDQWNELSNRMAVRSVDLAQATARAGSVIHNAGDDMAFLNGMTAALVQATKRSGQEIGNAIRTFGTYAFRLRSVALLEQMGIQVRNKATGDLRRFGDVLTQTAIKWDTFSDSQQRSIAQAIAGTRRQNEFLTLMREFPEVLEATVIAAESFGSAEEEAVILLDTAQKKAEQFRAGMQRLMAEFLTTGPLKAFLDLLNDMINALIEARELIFILGGALTVLAAKAVIAAIANSKLGASIKAVALGFKNLNPWIIAGTAAIVTAGIVWRSFRREVDNTTDALVTASQKEVGIVAGIKARANELDFLIKKYTDLKKAQEAEGTTEFTANLEDIGKKIEAIGKNIDQSFSFDGGIQDINRATELLDALRSQVASERTKAEASLGRRIDLLQRIIKFAEDYAVLLDSIPAATGEFALLDKDREIFEVQALVQAYNQNLGDIRQITGESMDEVADKIKTALLDTGLVSHDFWSKYMVDAVQSKEATDNLKVALITLEKELKTLQDIPGFRENIKGNILSIDELRAKIDELNESARHRAEMARMAGAVELNSLLLTSDAIGQAIALVEDQIAVYQANNKEVDKLQKLLQSLEKQQRNVNNRMIESGKALAGDAIGKALKRQTTAIDDLFAAEIKLAQGSKDNIAASNLQIQAMEQQSTAIKAAIALTKTFGLSADGLEEELRGVNSAIELEKNLLANLIRPLQLAKERTDALKKSEKEFNRIAENRMAIMELNLRGLQSVGAGEAKVAQTRVDALKKLIEFSKQYNLSIEVQEDLVRRLASAYQELGIARNEQGQKLINESLDEGNRILLRQLELSKALGASDISLAQQRIAILQREKQAVKDSLLFEETKKKQVKKLDIELADAANDLAVAEAKAATAATDAWIKEYNRRADAWAKLIGKGLSRKGLFETLERLQQEMVDRWIRTAFEPIINRLTKWEFQMLGISPEQLSIQEQNRNKVIMALRTGGNAVQSSIVTGANYHAAVIRAAMTNQPVPVIGGTQVSPVTIPMNTAAVGPVGPMPAAGGFSAGGTALALAPFVLSNAQDFATGRGGGVRAAGSVAGGIAGGILGGGNPAAIAFGAQMGNELVGALQGLKHAIWDDTEERKRPQAETLRQQVGSAINRGTFGNAAQITYHVENNVHMGFLIPDREGARRAANIIKKELSSIDSNVSVGA